MKKYLNLLIVLCLTASSAIAMEASGDLTIGGRFVDGSGTETSAKFLEYRDLDDQVTSDLNTFLTQDGFYLSIEGQNLGYDDQRISVSGGVFGQARFKLFYDELTHNYSLNDSSLYDGVGTTTLSVQAVSNPDSAGDSTNLSLWRPLDYLVERQQIGARLELTFNTPFFVSVDVTQTEKDGLTPWGVNIDSTTGGSDAAEIPAPIDTKTTNMTV